MTMEESSKPEETSAAEETPPHQPRPIPDATTWKMLQEAYKEIKGDTDPNDAHLFQAFDNDDNGYKIKIEIRQSPGKGRGVFCVDPISKDTLVCRDMAGRFYTEQQWRDFLKLLPNSLAQDCCEWAYVEQYKGKQAVFLDFNESALMNHGDSLSCWEKLLCRKATANLDERSHRGRWCHFASRDIQAGSELLVDYEDFHDYEHSLSWFESIWYEYFPDYVSDSDESSY
jgi:hypothetical protein